MDNPFTHGRDAFVFGTPRENNPHPEGSDEHEEWDDGWDDAESDTKRTDIDQKDDE